MASVLEPQAVTSCSLADCELIIKLLKNTLTNLAIALGNRNSLLNSISYKIPKSYNILALLPVVDSK